MGRKVLSVCQHARIVFGRGGIIKSFIIHEWRKALMWMSMSPSLWSNVIRQIHEAHTRYFPGVRRAEWLGRNRFQSLQSCPLFFLFF